ncbi:MAG: glycosyltransferase [Candidatus Marinimicrobia bacterium]|nr:glycosyltransferase [Candidatus Neomarinimicrobiota bacterium]MCF7880542.1 glycosyltransferase [Candidatus Neomarinimicrobiota bacterium]
MLKNNIKISACMMVKNEEELLPQCLESIKDIVDEIIVVDTGSDDGTVEISKSYGAKIYYHPWENDFSKHRNQSISYATGDWFLIIDADEKIDSEKVSVHKMKSHLREMNEEVHAVMATVVDHKSDETETVRFKSARIFRNGVGVHYEGIVHNKAVYDGIPKNSNLEIHHYGYDLDPEKMDAKFQRTSELLKKRIDENPEDFEAYFYLSNAYGSINDLEKTIQYAEKSLELMPDDGKDKRLYNSAYFTLTGSYLVKDDYKAAKYWAKKGVQKNKHDIGLYFLLTNIALKEKDYESVKRYGEFYLESYDLIAKDPVESGGQFIFHVDESSREGIQYWLLSAYLVLGDTDKFWELWSAVQMIVYAKEKLWKELLKNAETTKNGPLLLRLTGDIYQSIGENHSDVFLPLTKFILESENATDEIINLFSHIQQSHLDFFNDIFLGVLKTLQKQNQQEHIIDTFEKFNSDLVKTREFQYLLIQAAYELNKTELLEEQISTILDTVSSYNNLPDYILLIISHFLLQNDLVENFVQVTEILIEISGIQYNRVIDGLRDFAPVYEVLGENYLQNNAYFCMNLSLELSYKITGDFEIIRKIGDYYFKADIYNKSIKYYNLLLQNNAVDAQILQNLRKSFVAIDNHDGVAKCNELIGTLTSSP